MVKYYLKEEHILDHLTKYDDDLREAGVPKEERDKRIAAHYTENCVKKYTREEMDYHLNYWVDIILNMPGGYWYAQEMIQKPHNEFEHYAHKSTMSYEKGNVSSRVASFELNTESFIKESGN